MHSAINTKYSYYVVWVFVWIFLKYSNFVQYIVKLHTFCLTHIKSDPFEYIAKATLLYLYKYKPGWTIYLIYKALINA